MEIKTEKAYFIKKTTRAFEFNKEYNSDYDTDIVIPPRTGVFLIKTIGFYSYFQTLIPIKHDGKNKDVYVVLKEDEVGNTLSEFIDSK